jgi:predicted nucleic-acid-binding protein
MNALDTNILLRLLTDDDPAQAQVAAAFLERQAGEFFIGDVVLVETVWTLQRTRGFTRLDIASLLRALLERGDLVFEDADRVLAGVRSLETGGEFADALVVAMAQAQGCERLASFDIDLARRHPDFVIKPK